MTTPAVSGWKRVLGANRAVWVTAAIAVVALVAGVLVGRFVVSPADASASSDAPDPGLVTVPVEYGVLSNDLTLRGDVGFADSVEVTIDAASFGGAPVVTGAVPEVDSSLEPLSVALAVTGRPVIVLPGELPAYRTLEFGMRGPDVVQFKEAMAAVGIAAGDPASDLFDATAANALTALYERVGYAAPDGAEGAEEALRAAQDGVRGAQQQLDQARAELARASGGPSAVDIRQADNAVSSAQRAVEAAIAAKPLPPEDTAAALAQWNAGVGDARDNLALAQLQREQLGAGVNTSAERAAVDSAQQFVTDAQLELSRAQEATLPQLPSGEVLYLTDLPRRVDAVNVARGQVLQGAALIVSGAALTIVGGVAPADAELLSVGDRAQFDLFDGTAHEATITELTPGDSATERWSVVLEPDPLTSEQSMQLQGSNVRVLIAVGATAGEVMHVPVAALTAGSGGEARIEIVDGDPRDGERAETRLVEVETGLAAGGQVEVTPVDGEFSEGDLVVVGR
ncbi:hypothetical protein EV141_1223 [Microcella putealis]|uniref:HlyD family secretion protein n=1 Tax=Microcella putealis TaxID=337005 RepID=A0A4V2EWX5_9MICO|nr:hypothetical protein [Microcella putealis]RZS57510.1 hypothetical protein EV141_1223 [Microcella putealis]TQM24577.1 hypothetical protein BJ957_0832 [Microcella putealis]